MNIDELIKKRVDEKVSIILNEKTRINDSINATANLSEKIQVEVLDKVTGTHRQYKLTTNTRFDIFEDCLMSELKIKKIDYILKNQDQSDVGETKRQDDEHRVRDIIINHIDEKYYTKIVELRDPKEIINKLRDYKRLEKLMTTAAVRRELNNMRFNPRKENAIQFYERFEENVKRYDDIPGAGKMTDSEKRDMFMNAIMDAVPQVEILNSLNWHNTGKDTDYEGLKNYFLFQKQRENL